MQNKTNKNNRLIFCLNFRQISEMSKIQQKIPIFKKLSSGLSTGDVETFPLENFPLSLQPLENQFHPYMTLKK